MKDTYENIGIVTSGRVFEQREVEIINDAIRAALLDKRTHVIFEKDGVTPRSLVNPQQVSSVFHDLIRNKRLLTAVSSLLNDDIYVFQLGVNLKQSFAGDIWYWHRDFPTYHFQDFIPQPQMVNVLIYLDDFTRDNGSFMYVPSTHYEESEHTKMVNKGTSHTLHYSGEDELKTMINKHGIQFADGPAGTVYFMNTNLIHGSGANMGPKPRRLITLTFNAISNRSTKRSKRPNLVHDDSCATGLLNEIGFSI